MYILLKMLTQTSTRYNNNRIMTVLSTFLVTAAIT